MKPERLMPLVVVALALIAFAPSLENGFVYDDHLTIVGHPAVTGHDPLGPWKQPFWPAGTSSDLLYRPLAMQSLWLDAWPSGGAPAPGRVHLTQLLLHVLCALLVGAIGRVVNGPGAGAVAAALFAAHPLLTEAVATGYGRSELLAALFVLLAVLRRVGAPSPRRGLVLAVLVFCAGASKEHALLLWPALLLLDLVAVPRGGWRPALPGLLREHAPCAVALGLLLALRTVVLGGLTADATQMAPLVAPAAHADVAERALLSAWLLALTARLLVDPGRLTPVWSAPALDVPRGLEPDVLAGFLLLAAALAGMAAAWRRGPGPRTLALLGGVFLLLPLQVVPASSWLFAERWLYLPAAFFAWAAAALLARWAPRAALPLGLGLALALVPASRAYCRVFRDDVTMARETVRRLPQGYQGHRILATSLLQAGRGPEAEAAALASERLFGPQPETCWVLSRTRLERGDVDGALRALSELRRLMPVMAPTLDLEERRIRELR